jgi:hypothetical protein
MNLEKPALDRIVAAYLRNLENNFEGDDFWSPKYIWELLPNDPELVLNIILGLIAAAPSREALEYVGAACLEDLLQYHGSQFIKRMRTEGNCNKRFLAALYIARVSETDRVFEELAKVKMALGIAERAPDLLDDLFIKGTQE